MIKLKILEKSSFSGANKRLDLRGNTWSNEFKNLAVSLSAPFSFGGFAPQALYRKEDYLETAMFLSVNGLSADQGCDLFESVRKKMPALKSGIFLTTAPRSKGKKLRKNQTRLTPNKTCFLSQLRKHSIRGLEEEWDSSVEKILDELKDRFKLNRSIRIAFDYHLVPFYGNPESEYVHKSLARNGTNYFFKYISCCLCTAGYRVKLGIKMLKKGESPLKWTRSWLERILARGIKVEWVLLDRGFYGISTCQMIDALGLKFLMPAKKTKPIKNLAWKYYTKQVPSHHDYTLKTPVEKFKGTLVFATRKRNLHEFRRACQDAALSDQQVVKGILVYFTNWRPPKERRARVQMVREIPGIYKSRWGIETAYRMLRKFHVPTCSKVPSTRYFFFIFQALMYNCWVLTNLVLILRFNAGTRSPILTHSAFVLELRSIWTQHVATSQKPPPEREKSSILARLRSFFRRDQN